MVAFTATLYTQERDGFYTQPGLFLILVSYLLRKHNTTLISGKPRLNASAAIWIHTEMLVVSSLHSITLIGIDEKSYGEVKSAEHLPRTNE